jgi:DNA-binding MarR family transcriptional regulator
MNDPRLAQLIAHRLAMASSAVSADKRTRLCDPNGLNTHEWTLLVLLKNLGPSGPKTLVRKGRIEKWLVWRTAQRLQRQRLIRRKPSRADSRSHILELTEQGVSMLETLVPEALAYERSLLRGWRPDEVEAFKRLLRKIESAARAVGA